jgi:hypothetical protein
MQKVYLKKRALNDLERLFIRLIEYKKFPLTRQEAIEYVRLIKEKCYELNNTIARRRTSNSDHIKFGKYVYRFDKHDHIQWFIIYDLDKYNNIAIKKIISNQSTKK